MPAMDVMALGRMAIITDSGRATIGLWQPEHKGFQVLADLNRRRGSGSSPATSRPDRLLPHGLRLGHLLPGRHRRLPVRPSSRARRLLPGHGRHGLPPRGVPLTGPCTSAQEGHHDKAIEQAVDLGATVVVEAQDTPYGKLATLLDPTGAQFKLVDDS